MKRKVKFFILMCCIATYFTSFAQQDLMTDIPENISADFKWRTQVRETITTYYIAENPVKLSALDKSQLKRTSTIQLVQKYYPIADEMPITYIEREQTENIYEDWMVEPKKFFIDHNGISAYDSTNTLLKMIPHSSKYQELANFGERKFASFKEVTDDRIQELQDSGNDITKAADGSVIAIGEKGSLLYNKDKKVKTVTRIDDKGELLSVFTTQYVSLQSLYPAYPNDEDVLPLYTKETSKKELPSGACVKFVRLKKYNYLNITKGDTDKPLISNESNQGVIQSKSSSKDLSNKEIKWYPNPASESLVILNNNHEEITITIYTLQGKLVKQLEAFNKKSIDISDLNKGIYFLSIQSDSNETISKFVKQ